VIDAHFVGDAGREKRTSSARRLKPMLAEIGPQGGRARQATLLRTPEAEDIAHLAAFSPIREHVSSAAKQRWWTAAGRSGSLPPHELVNAAVKTRQRRRATLFDRLCFAIPQTDQTTSVKFVM